MDADQPAERQGLEVQEKPFDILSKTYGLRICPGNLVGDFLLASLLGCRRP
jgi:hypothetical protein